MLNRPGVPWMMKKPAPSPTPMGQLLPGNIDVHHRPIVHNTDPTQARKFGVEPGSISTVHSASFRIEDPGVAKRFNVPVGSSVLIPTVLWNDPNDPSKGGRLVDPHEAYQYFLHTGQHLGLFQTDAHADAYAKSLHEAQDKEYRGK